MQEPGAPKHIPELQGVPQPFAQAPFWQAPFHDAQAPLRQPPVAPQAPTCATPAAAGTGDTTGAMG